LIINSIGFTGTNVGDFAQTNTCTLGAPGLAAGANCTISVTFRPPAMGARSASLAIGSSDPTNPTLYVTLTGTGIAPVASVSPAALAFANQGVTTISAAQTVTLTNSGTAALTINSIATNLPDFVIQPATTCGATLAAPVAPATSTTCTISVAFQPTTTGLRSGLLTIANSDPAHPALTVSLSGTGVVPIAAVAPPSLTFPLQVMNTLSTAQTVVLSNTGGWPLTIASIAITGANPGDYAISANTCPILGAGLAAAANCSIAITFTPTAAGTRTAALTITDNSNSVPGSVQSVGLTGSATGVAVSPAALVFANQLVGTASATRAVTVNNVNTVALTIVSVTVTGANPGDFVLNNGCGARLNPGRNCTVRVSFSPAAAGARAGVLTIATSDPFSPALVALSGTGIAPINTVAPASLAFSGPMNVTTAAQPVTVTNTGTAPLTISSIALGGANANQFAQTNNCTATLAVGAGCTINVTFRPTAAAPLTKTASLAVNVAAPATSQSVTLTGAIIVPTYTVAPLSLPFGNQARNTRSAAQPVTITNTGTAPLSIVGFGFSGPNATLFAQTNNCPANLAGGAFCTVSVTFRPTTVGAKSASLNVTVAAPATGQSVGLTGTGI
jgi:hypothetical protein